MGSAEDVPEFLSGLLLDFNLTGNRRDIVGNRVINNRTFDDLTGTEQYIIGKGFGILTDIETSPNGNLFVVSLPQGTIYEIFRR